MFGIILGLGAALTYGAADFLAGLASRRACVLSVVVWSQFVGLVALLLLLAVLPPTSPTRTDFLWGAAAGVAGAVGISLLYRALAVGRMSVVSPITAVVAAIIPVIFGVLRGERPSVVAYGGIALALLAVFLISSSAEQGQDGRPLHPDRRPFLSEPGLVEASVSGVAIGAFYIVISRAGHTAGLWPLVSYRIVSTTLVAAAALLTRRSLRPSRPSLQPIIFT
ncbi:MAG: DMT family transporter, partial [Candidatus Eremiobacteraeota bacterium]|nr:DMT family transporter [Candidatus Eremiobacteraeota bacterium]